MSIFIMRGAFNLLLPAGTPVLSFVDPATVPIGQSITATLIGTNTHFVQGTTQVLAEPGITVGTVTLSDPLTLTVQLTAAASATAGPRTLVGITGAEQAILPNGLTVQ